MRRSPAIGAVLLGLTCVALLAGTASAATPKAAEGPYPPGGFRLRGSHGFSISVAAYTEEEGSGHGEITVTASRPHEFASYTAPARVTADSIRARLGSLGRVDMVLNRSGLDKTVTPHCFRHPESFETGAYEGVFEFNGEGGFTDARATRVAAVPTLEVFSRPIDCNGGGSGEEFGPGLPGARIRAVSYADGRTVKFQMNKNRPGGKTIFTASLAERRGGIKIFRELNGVAPAGAFRYDPKVRTATLGPPAPFAGTAHLTRGRDSLSPFIRGNLKLTFPGHTVGLTGPSVHVSLEHARVTHGDRGNITVGI
ncbi:MAG TPA: hypothetical protein VJ204_15430 [Solirubrobacterales bacterium]|nr:hypothetical protein [Solirubrobacterales bacterium]